MQKKFHDSKARFKAFIGGFGSGKTYALVYEALALGMMYPKNRILIGRLTYPELESTTKLEFENIIPPDLIKRRYKDKSINGLELWNGTMYFFRALDNMHKLKSLNLGAFFIDEASEVTEDIFFMLVSRLRYMKVPERFGVLATNPEGHNWIWRLFINKQIEDEKAVLMGVKYNPDLFEGFVSKTTDNPYNPADYVDMLRQIYGDKWIRRYVEVSFEEFSGLVFYEFDTSKHLIERRNPVKVMLKSRISDKVRIQYEDLEFSEEFGRFIIAIDPGVDTTAVLFSFYDSRMKKLYLIDEIYKTHIGLDKLAELIKSVNHKFKIYRPYYLIDPSSVRLEQTSGKSIARELSAKGISPLRKANNDINFGILRVNEMFRKKQLFVYKSLINFQMEITDYYLDENTGKPKTRQKDHLLDTLRYIVTSLSPSEITDISKSEEQALKYQKRNGLRMFARNRGKSKRHYIIKKK